MDQQGDDDLKSFVDRIVFKESLVGKIHYGEEFEFTAEQAKVVQGCSEQAFELSQRFHRDWSDPSEPKENQLQASGCKSADIRFDSVMCQASTQSIRRTCKRCVRSIANWNRRCYPIRAPFHMP